MPFKRLPIIAVAACALAVNSFALAPASAQEQPAQSPEQCGTEVQNFWSKVQQSDLQAENKNQIAAVLQQALTQAQTGDADACQKTLQQVKDSVNL